MAERQGMPKCFVVRHEGNESNEHLSTMMWVRRRQLALPLQKSAAIQSDQKGRFSRPSTSATGSDLGCVKLCWNANRRIQDQIQSRLYYHLTPVNISSESTDGCGAVFNLEFSPIGDTLVTAYEGEAMQLFDPISAKLITKIPNAHTDCVNCIRFLDSRTFASGSDDKTIALWDIRNLKRKICTLKGHSNWVKSIEYCQKSGLLVTSAFDGNVLAWDINRYQDEMQYTKLFHLESLMRTRLTPDSSKLIMSTSEGYYLVIHDLDLTSLATDFDEFEPSEYCDLLLDEAKEELKEHEHNHLFHRSWNRPEIVMDFPEEGFAECISSLVVHPQGWCMVSRYTTTEEDQELTCVHDLQETSIPDDEPKQDPNQRQFSPFKAKQRLLYYAVEPNDGKGYIKELSISPDGRIICSSFSHGVRLLAFNTQCSELCDIQYTNPPAGPQGLKQVKLVSCHRATVLTSRFSPTQCLLVSGCLEGKVVFHHPYL
ncbi:DDB1- and CUL4-associated factor 10 homolog [Lytechinus variegatus]|uniref:DDB1- and CUL4-associated factor 10 homolog n=1 Tax=Lytechinus variegatus TaxID=7654 RepID=UPI001BB28294|nr:DDB1- and CUL4-associated factor 10 homolog [Lytechinus variegatus]